MHNIDEYLSQVPSPPDLTPSRFDSAKVEVDKSDSDLCDSAPIFNEAIDDNFEFALDYKKGKGDFSKYEITEVFTLED